MIRTILIVFLLFNLPLYGQQKVPQGEAIYSVSIVKSMRTDNQISMNSRLPMILRESSFSLKFKGERSVFDINGSSKLGQEDRKVAAGFAGVRESPFWQDSQSIYSVSQPVKRFDLGSFLLVYTTENGSHTEWVITDETKEIAGYPCFKATRMDIDVGSKRVARQTPVVAWFSPEIPFPFGPKNYGGLPGLIMELLTPHELYGITSIKLNKSVDIPVLPDFERMSSNDHGKLLYDKVMRRN